MNKKLVCVARFPNRSSGTKQILDQLFLFKCDRFEGELQVGLCQY